MFGGKPRARCAKQLLDEIRRPQKPGGVVVEIALFKRERFGDLKEASLEIAGASGRQLIHVEKLSQNRCELRKKRVLF